MKALFILIFLIIPLGISANVKIESVNYYAGQNYNDDTGFEIIQTITVSHTGPAEDFFITMSGGNNGTPENRRVIDWQGYTVDYFLYNNPTDKTVIKDLTSNPSSNEVLTGTFPKGRSTMNVNYYYAVPAGVFPPSGYFSDTFAISLYSGTVANYILKESVNVQVSIQVPNMISISLVPEGSPYNISSTELTFDFGVLTSGLIRSADLIVKSNLSYFVNFTSANGGVLKRTDQWEISEIPYTLSVNGSPVIMQPWQAVTVLQGSPTGPTGSRNNIDVVIGDFWDVSTGTFEDQITITISSL